MPLIHVMHILVFISIGLKVSCMLLVGATTQIKVGEQGISTATSPAVSNV